jgi:hypothetical protein
MNRASGQGQFERYRLMVISNWPDSALKRAALESARAALQRELAFASPEGADPAGLARSQEFLSPQGHF